MAKKNTFKLRMQRANSWLEAGLSATSDEEIFILLWIAFNAAYGNTLNNDEKEKLDKFMRLILENDAEKDIARYLDEDEAIIENILGNEYIFDLFWHQKGQFNKKLFERQNKRMLTSWKLQRDEMPIITEVLRRLYTFRNQIMHGSRTFGPQSLGTRQLRDGCDIMKRFVPVIIKIMEDNPKKNWGGVAYPHIDY